MVSETIAAPDMEAIRQDILAIQRAQLNVAPEPGEVQVGEEISTGEQEAGMMISKLAGAGVAFIWDTRTGERSRTNNNMLPTQLSKLRDDGSLVFTQRDPGITPKRGNLKCLLHPELRRDHPEYDTWGLLTCSKSNLASPQDVKSHMQMRHKREWATIEDTRIERERAEDRAIQRQNAEATMAALKAAVENRSIAPLADANSPEEPIREKRGPFGRPLKTS